MRAERLERVVAKQRRYSRSICCAWGTSLNSEARYRPPLPREQRNRSVAHTLRLGVTGLTELSLGLCGANGSTDALDRGRYSDVGHAARCSESRGMWRHSGCGMVGPPSPLRGSGGQLCRLTTSPPEVRLRACAVRRDSRRKPKRSLACQAVALRKGERRLERATGIEPVSEAWEASVLPLY
jgi:hypothetical protein